MKDNFSTQSDDYAKFRPKYTQSLIDYLIANTSNHTTCWDCGTGNGQLAVQLSSYFDQVHATDISEKQLVNAIQKQNIHYTKQPAEETNFPDQNFDLITVAQAAHWFDHIKFNAEVKRVLKPGGLVALIGYGLVNVDDPFRSIIEDFYWNVTKPYWDPERDHIEESYQTIPFPYDEIKDLPNFNIKKQMNLNDLVGYISTWSAVQHFKKKNGFSPIDTLTKNLHEYSSNGPLEVTFPVFARIGRII